MTPLIALAVYLAGYFIAVFVHRYIDTDPDPEDEWQDTIMCVTWPITIPLILIILPLVYAHKWVIKLADRARGK